MSVEDSPILAQKTWDRSLNLVAKVGYMDGASDGQTSVYQDSFNEGYEQGFNFGLDMGFKSGTLCMKQKVATHTNTLLDPRKINCQLCLNSNQDNITNLKNLQKEKNMYFLDHI